MILATNTPADHLCVVAQLGERDRLVLSPCRDGNYALDRERWMEEASPPHPAGTYFTTALVRYPIGSYLICDECNAVYQVAAYRARAGHAPPSIIKRGRIAAALIRRRHNFTTTIIVEKETPP